MTWYFQSSLDLLQQQVEYDREPLFKLQEQIKVRKHHCIIDFPRENQPIVYTFKFPASVASYFITLVRKGLLHQNLQHEDPQFIIAEILMAHKTFLDCYIITIQKCFMSHNL